MALSLRLVLVFFAGFQFVGGLVCIAFASSWPQDEATYGTSPFWFSIMFELALLALSVIMLFWLCCCKRRPITRIAGIYTTVYVIKRVVDFVFVLALTPHTVSETSVWYINVINSSITLVISTSAALLSPIAEQYQTALVHRIVRYWLGLRLPMLIAFFIVIGEHHKDEPPLPSTFISLAAILTLVEISVMFLLFLAFLLLAGLWRHRNTLRMGKIAIQMFFYYFVVDFCWHVALTIYIRFHRRPQYAGHEDFHGMLEAEVIHHWAVVAIALLLAASTPVRALSALEALARGSSIIQCLACWRIGNRRICFSRGVCSCCAGPEELDTGLGGGAAQGNAQSGIAREQSFSKRWAQREASLSSQGSLLVSRPAAATTGGNGGGGAESKDDGGDGHPRTASTASAGNEAEAAGNERSGLMTWVHRRSLTSPAMFPLAPGAIAWLIVAIPSGVFFGMTETNWRGGPYLGWFAPSLFDPVRLSQPDCYMIDYYALVAGWLAALACAIFACIVGFIEARTMLWSRCYRITIGISTFFSSLHFFSQIVGFVVIVNSLKCDENLYNMLMAQVLICLIVWMLFMYINLKGPGANVANNHSFWEPFRFFPLYYTMGAPQLLATKVGQLLQVLLAIPAWLVVPAFVFLIRGLRHDDLQDDGVACRDISLVWLLVYILLVLIALGLGRNLVLTVRFVKPMTPWIIAFFGCVIVAFVVWVTVTYTSAAVEAFVTSTPTATCEIGLLVIAAIVSAYLLILAYRGNCFVCSASGRELRRRLRTNRDEANQVYVAIENFRSHVRRVYTADSSYDVEHSLQSLSELLSGNPQLRDAVGRNKMALLLEHMEAVDPTKWNWSVCTIAMNLMENAFPHRPLTRETSLN